MGPRDPKLTSLPEKHPASRLSSGLSGFPAPQVQIHTLRRHNGLPHPARASQPPSLQCPFHQACLTSAVEMGCAAWHSMCVCVCLTAQGTIAIRQGLEIRMPTQARQLVSGQRVDNDWAAQAPSTGRCVLSCSPSLAQRTQVEAISSSSEFCKSSHKFMFLGETDNFKIWASTCRPVSVLYQPVRLWAPGLQLCHEQMVVWIQTRELTAAPPPPITGPECRTCRIS